MKKYLKTLIIVIAIMISLLLLEKLIPNTKSRINIINSNEYYQDYYKEQRQNLNNLLSKRTFVDVNGELRELSIIYLESNKNYYSEMIEMNFDSESAAKIINHQEIKDFAIDSDYSRYWHGNIVLLKPLLSFFTMKTIHKIYYVLFSILFCILIFKLLQNSKILAIAFVLSSISINLFLITNCTNLLNVFALAMITSLILIKKYENSNPNIENDFLIIGLLTAYFDLITCETITLTLPLFIYIFLHLKDNKTINIKKVILAIILWLVGYAGAYLVKWLLLIIHYHGSFTSKVIDPMKIRVYAEEKGFIPLFVENIKSAFNFIIPYENNLKLNLVILSTITIIINFLIEKKNRINYLFLMLISIVPFVRYLVLSSHVNYHNYFTYRAFLPLVILLITSILLLIKNIIKKRSTIN